MILPWRSILTTPGHPVSRPIPAYQAHLLGMARGVRAWLGHATNGTLLQAFGGYYCIFVVPGCLQAEFRAPPQGPGD